jgi:hypothetical protein
LGGLFHKRKSTHHPDYIGNMTLATSGSETKTSRGVNPVPSTYGRNAGVDGVRVLKQPEGSAYTEVDNVGDGRFIQKADFSVTGTHT